MSHPLQQAYNRDQLLDAIQKNKVEEYFVLLRPLEAPGADEKDFYSALKELLQHTPPDESKLFTLEKRRTEYWAARQASAGETHFEANRLGLHWLSICREVREPNGVLFFTLSGRDREEEIKRLIYQQYPSQLRPFFLTDELGRRYLPGIIKFFLRVYNLPEAWRLTWKMFKSGGKDGTPVRRGHWGVFELAPYLVPLLIIIALFLGLGYPLHQWNFWAGLLGEVWACRPQFNLADISAPITLLAAGYAICALAFVLALFRRIHLLAPLLLPRMLTGAMVGYLVLIFSNDVWNMIDRLHHTAGEAIVALTIIGAFLCLANEMRSTLRRTGRVFARTVAVLLMGLAETFSVSLILCDLFGAGMSAQPEAGLPGIFGRLYPRFIVITAPLALLIGIFAQTIWEDKPITEPF
jgi:hypothetical protein